jgi:hypothetical protein
MARSKPGLGSRSVNFGQKTGGARKGRPTMIGGTLNLSSGGGG